MGCGCFGSNNPPPALKEKEKIKEKIYQDTDQNDLSDENVYFSQQPFPIKGDRLKQLLHRSIGALTFIDQYKNIQAGSATLISPNIILTVAHNIYNKKYGSYNSDFKFYLGADGIGEKYHEVESWRIPKEYQNCSVKAKLPFDYGIMKLKKPIQFNEYLSLFQVCTECLQKNKESTQLRIYGFPCAYPRAPGDPPGFMRSFQGNFKALDDFGKQIKLHQYGLSRQNRIPLIQASEFKLGYTISTLPGQSGCPVVVGDKIIAVHTGGDKEKCNIGRIIDKSFIQNIRKWGKQLKADQYSIKKEKICFHQTLVLKSKSIVNKENAWIDPEKKIITSAQEKRQKDQTKSEVNKEQNLKIQNSRINHYIPAAIQKEKSKQPINNLNNIKGGDEILNSLSLEEQIKRQPKNTKINLVTKLQMNHKRLQCVDLREYGNLLELNLCSNKLRQIDLAHCPRLTRLHLRWNQLQRIDLANNKHLTWLGLENNQLQEVDVRANVNLIQLFLENNQLQEVDVRANVNLTQLNLYNNQLQEVDVRDNVNLTWLSLSSNQLQEVDVRANVSLTQLGLYNNQLQEVDVRANVNLTWLGLYNNQLQEVDVRANVNLTYLGLGNNQLQEVDVRANVNLTWLSLHSNRIAEIDLTKNTKLDKLFLQENRLARVRLWIAEQVREDSYTGRDYFGLYFNLSHQWSAACGVQLMCLGQAVREKGARIAREWNQRYSRHQNNKHNCKYVISTL